MYPDNPGEDEYYDELADEYEEPKLTPYELKERAYEAQE